MIGFDFNVSHVSIVREFGEFPNQFFRCFQSSVAFRYEMFRSRTWIRLLRVVVVSHNKETEAHVNC